MSGFEGVADQIRASARDLRSAAGTVKSADPSGDVGALSAAMPSRLLSAFPVGTPVARVTLDEAVERVRALPSVAAMRQKERA